MFPLGWPDHQVRYTKNIPQGEGLPDEGVIRVDVLFCSVSYYNPPVSFDEVWGVLGHFAYYDGSQVVDPTDAYGSASCPPWINTTNLESCMNGDWKNLDQSDDWSDSQGNPLQGQPDYARYEFRNKDEFGIEIELAVGYYYWDLDWPDWAKHQQKTGPPDVFVYIDFVDSPFPPE